MCNVDVQRLLDATQATNQALRTECANLRTLQAPRIAAIQLESENTWLRRELAKAQERIAALEYVLTSPHAAPLSTPHEWMREAGSHVSRCTSCGLRTSVPLEIVTTCEEYRRSLAPKRKRKREAVPCPV